MLHVYIYYTSNEQLIDYVIEDFLQISLTLKYKIKKYSQQNVKHINPLVLWNIPRIFCGKLN